jgi:hypothetical protein
VTGSRPLFLYTDEDITDRLAMLLRERGRRATSVAGERRYGYSDEQQLAFAASHGWTILTYNVQDFARLARSWYAEGREHAGIVLSRQFSVRETGELLRQVCNLMDRIGADEMWNTVRYLQSYA